MPAVWDPFISTTNSAGCDGDSASIAPWPGDEGVAFVTKQLEDEFQHLLLVDQVALLLLEFELREVGLGGDFPGLGFGKGEPFAVERAVALRVTTSTVWQTAEIFGQAAVAGSIFPERESFSIFPWLSHFRTTASLTPRRLAYTRINTGMTCGLTANIGDAADNRSQVLWDACSRSWRNPVNPLVS